jgi:hypothetical protein
VNVAQNLTELKKHIFYELLNLSGRVFILVRYSEDVHIGNRGFLPEEKEKGIILVFNKKMNFEWNETGIFATLGFGTKAEKCFVPPQSIISVFSPDLNAQFSVSGEEKIIPEETAPDKKEIPSADDKVIKVNFNRKK